MEDNESRTHCNMSFRSDICNTIKDQPHPSEQRGLDNSF